MASNKASAKKEAETSFSEKVKMDTNRKSEQKGDDSILELMEALNNNEQRKDELPNSPSRGHHKSYNDTSMDIANISPIVGSSKKDPEDIEKFFG